MSNFSGGNGRIVYTEPEGSEVYRARIKLLSEHKDDRVGLCMTMYGDGTRVALGIRDEDDVQQFLYSAAVQAKLIKDGEPLILMKKIGAEDAA